MDFDEIEHFEKFYGEPECYKALPKINASKYPPLESNGNSNGNGGGNGKDDGDIKDDKGNGQNEDTKNDQNDNDNNNNITSHSHHLNENLIYDLKIIGIPSSIDNDIWGTDYTLGADTALNRIIESIDHLSSTMKSHQRIFVIEVMGRSCGWLALMSGLSCLSDYVLISEDPPEDWRKEVMDKVFFAKNHGKPGIFIVISEGACDRKGIKIPSMDVVNHIASFNIDVRLLKLGHIQRGGPTSAFDRILGTLMGIKAHELSTEMEDNESKIVVYSNGEIQSKNLNTVIEMIDKVGIYEKDLNFREVLNSRGSFYNLAYSFYKEFLEGKSKVDAPFMEDVNLKTLLKDNPTLQKKFESKNRSKMEKINGCSSNKETSSNGGNKDGVVNGGSKEGSSSNEPYNNNNHFNFINNRVLLKDKKKIGILQCGSRSSGMNTALNSIIQYSFTVGLEPVYILNGFDGLQQEQIISSKLYEFSTDYNNGGASLGLCGIKYVNLENIKKVLIKKGIENLIIIGDSECLEVVEGICGSSNKVGDKEERGKGNGKVSSRELNSKDNSNNNNSNPTFLNIILIPAASSNNIPNTDISLGVDTALNTILRVSDCAKLSTFSMKKNVFVLEVAGGNSGYLTLMGGIAAGAFDCFIPERKYLIGHLSETAHRLRNRYKESKRHGIVIFRNEKTFCSISTESFCRVLKTDGKGLFETDYASGSQSGAYAPLGGILVVGGGHYRIFLV
ncbi:6-phosphofructokinase [Nosema bombycis CQ1]|uniref:6-phosphofructokinase n=1 Tax=Nosema bombycis (strain CQ1 / CVCC 102059) TaxID=578461 RepID=R0MFM0_NOSB1|nr:6-phosphofructokinase [Nosema bombycis CQ1]|eukprot:EOB11558.1 6-phosphofructokinase [Nosema bombycis CQ1]